MTKDEKKKAASKGRVKTKSRRIRARKHGEGRGGMRKRSADNPIPKAAAAALAALDFGQQPKAPVKAPVKVPPRPLQATAKIVKFPGGKVMLHHAMETAPKAYIPKVVYLSVPVGVAGAMLSAAPLNEGADAPVWALKPGMKEQLARTFAGTFEQYMDKTLTKLPPPETVKVKDWVLGETFPAQYWAPLPHVRVGVPVEPFVWSVTGHLPKVPGLVVKPTVGGIKISTVEATPRLAQGRRPFGSGRARDGKSSSAAAYRGALKFINATYGKVADAYDVWRAIAANVYYTATGEPAFGLSPREIAEGLYRGELELDAPAILWALGSMLAVDHFIGAVSKRMREFAEISDMLTTVQLGHKFRTRGMAVMSL